MAVAFVPRRRDVITVAALGAAVLIALQLGVTHWFYLYLVWFLPLLLIALLARRRQGAGRSTGSIDSRAGRPSAADDDRVHPWVVLGRVVAQRHVRAHDGDRLLAPHADHAAARAGHARRR